ncbi:MAG: membrane protein of unknown function, partial [Nitrosopumilales archaeon]
MNGQKISAWIMILILGSSMVSIVDAQIVSEELHTDNQIIKNNFETKNILKPQISTGYKLSLSENLDVKNNDNSRSTDIAQPAKLITEKKVSMKERVSIFTEGENNGIFLSIKTYSDRKAMMERILNNERSKFGKTINSNFLNSESINSPSLENAITENSINSKNEPQEFQFLINNFQIDNIFNFENAQYNELQTYFSKLDLLAFNEFENILEYHNDFWKLLDENGFVLVEKTNFSFLILLIPFVGLLIIRLEKSELNFHQFQRFFCFVFIFIIISSTVSLPMSVSFSYWGIANAEEFDKDLPLPFISVGEPDLILEGNGDYITLQKSKNSKQFEELTISAWIMPDYKHGSQEFTI